MRPMARLTRRALLLSSGLALLGAMAQAQTIKSQTALQTELGQSCAAQGLSAKCITPAKLGDLIASAVPGISAGVSAAGNSQSTATPLTAQFSTVTSVASGTGVELMAPVAGQLYAVANQGANPLTIYPASGVAIDGLTVNMPVSVAAGSTALFVALSVSAENSLP
jgi:hypothetical protein